MQPQCRILQADAEHLPLEGRSVDLVFGSPPYPQKGAIACDIRETQCERTRRRIVEVQATCEVIAWHGSADHHD